MRPFMIALAGACIGGAAALLFAPQSGRATRAFIRDKAVGYGHDVQDFVGSKSVHLKNRMEGIRHRASDAFDAVREEDEMMAAMESDMQPTVL